MRKREKLHLEGLTYQIILGAYEEERKEKAQVLVDLDLFYDFPQEDSLERAVDYAQVVKEVQAWLEEKEFRLLEKLASELAFVLLEHFPALKGVKVRAHKPSAPLGLPFSDLYAECLAYR